MEPFGVVVEAQDKSTHLIHISQISEDYVDDVVKLRKYWKSLQCISY